MTASCPLAKVGSLHLASQLDTLCQAPVAHWICCLSLLHKPHPRLTTPASSTLGLLAFLSELGLLLGVWHP